MTDLDPDEALYSAARVAIEFLRLAESLSIPSQFGERPFESAAQRLERAIGAHVRYSAHQQGQT